MWCVKVRSRLMRVVEVWEEQLRAVLLEPRRGETETPETTASSARTGSMEAEAEAEAESVQRGERAREQRRDEEDDDWMWGGMKGFGGERGGEEVHY